MASLHRVSVAYGGGFSCSEGQCCWSFTWDHCCRCGFTSPTRCCWGDFTSKGLLLRWIHWGSLPLWWFQHTGSVLKRCFTTQRLTEVVSIHKLSAAGVASLQKLFSSQGQCCWGGFTTHRVSAAEVTSPQRGQYYWCGFTAQGFNATGVTSLQRISAAEVASLKRISASGWLHHRRANAALWLHYTWSMLMGGFITQSVLLRWLHYTDGQCCCGNIITQGQCWGGGFTTHRQCWGGFTTQGQCRWAGLARGDVFIAQRFSAA